PERFDPPPRVVHLPDPRSATKGAKPMYFLCRGGRIMPLDQDRLLLVGETNLRRAGAKLDNKTEIDCNKLINYFKSKSLGNEYFNLRLRIFNHQLHLEFARKRPDIGETTEQIQAKTSQFQRAIRRTNPKSNYVRYLVWNDSFDTYLEARGISDSQGLAAGWQMHDYKDEYRIWFGNRVKCEGTPPPPPPKPKPKPDPTQPKPPPRKPLPTDQID
ncbi:MAG: hypothetical protein OER86_01270, partial [Phycisphaerae bacterium]|nr:hypothetical protein [Phycisphaerae bacterium]